MKKLFLLAMLLFVTFSIAVAQPVTMTKGQADNNSIQKTECRDVLHPEIYNSYGNIHYQHPYTDFLCDLDGLFSTTEEYTWYQWETNIENLPEGGDLSSQTIFCWFRHSDYLKVTVGDEYGNTGTDSIWFNIKDKVNILDNFMMAINENGHPVLSGTITEEYTRLQVKRINTAQEATTIYTDNNPTIGEWELIDEDIIISEDNLWAYVSILKDTCQKNGFFYAPSIILNTTETGEDYFLNIKSYLHTQNGSFPPGEYVYYIYSIDEQGIFHHFMDENGYVILAPETTEWKIPGPHIDPYYVCVILQVLDDGEYLPLSSSNWIENPLLDLTGLKKIEAETTFTVYPNPAHGQFTMEGEGIVHVSNVLGQEILTKEIDGKETLELPKGLYFVKLNGITRKIVVE